MAAALPSAPFSAAVSLPHFTNFTDLDNGDSGNYHLIMTRPRVVVRAFNDEALVRWVRAVERSTVYVVDAANLSRLETGIFDVPPVGFPVQCVYEFSGQRETRVSAWHTLKRWDSRSFQSRTASRFASNDFH